MANISNKNINTLVEDFIRNPKKFESYIKHCLNTLKNYNWLRTNQFNKDINDYDYFMKMYRYIGFGLFDFSFLY